MRQFKWFGVCILLVLVACGSSSGAQDDGKTTDTEQKKMPVDEEKIDGETLKGNQAFAFDLFQQLKQDDENVFISPYSISVVLSMVLAGAETETESEMKNVMNYVGLEDRGILDTYKNYSAYLSNAGEKVKIEIANSVWLDENFEVKDAYGEKMTDKLRSEVFQQDLSDASIVGAMNDWVSQNTNGMIDKLIEDPYEPAARMLLTNAIYFNGKWEHPFEEKFTEEGTFHLADGTDQRQKLMHQTSGFAYVEQDDYQAVRLPYGEENYSMYAVLPEKGHLNDFVKGFDAVDFTNMKQQMNQEEVELTVPKFKMEYGVKSLKESLINMGMERMFTSSADLTGMSSRDLFVDDVNHKAIIDVTEEGTEAAAVSQAVIVEESATVEEPPKVFKADRPFFYIIADEKYDSILFMGTYEGELEK